MPPLQPSQIGWASNPDRTDNPMQQLSSDPVRSASARSLASARSKVSFVTPKPVHRIASKQLWPMKYTIDLPDCACGAIAALAVVFICYWLVWYGATMLLASHVHWAAFGIPLILIGMCCIFPGMGVAGVLNCCSFFTNGCAWMAFPVAAFVTYGAMDLGSMSVKHGISVEYKKSFSEEAFYFTDGYVATHLQQEDSHTSCSGSGSKKSCSTTAWAVAPVFKTICEVPNCTAMDSFRCTQSDCVDRKISFMGLVTATGNSVTITPQTGHSCPNYMSGWGSRGICGHAPRNGDPERIKSTCQRMMTMHGYLLPRSACDDWPYLELGDVQKKAGDGLAYGHAIFGVAAALLLASLCFALLCKDAG